MKVLIVDDHALVRDALAHVLAGLIADLTVFEAGEPESAFRTIEREPELDLVLLDLSLPGMHGLTALRSLRASHPAVAVVVVSATSDRDSVKQALDAGAMGFIPKSSSNEIMKNALRLVLAGSVYVPPELVGRGSVAQAIEAPARQHQRTPADIGLTQRQAEILALMMAGQPNKRICRELDLAESTVKNQISVILKALGATSRMQAVLMAGKLDLRLPSIGKGSPQPPDR
jgi:DNA-binding NarL/FixJ family response regulator